MGTQKIALCPKCKSATKLSGHRDGKQKHRCKNKLCGFETVRPLWSSMTKEEDYITIETDKKVGQFDWREVLSHLEDRKKIHKKGSWSQDIANIKIKTNHEKIIIQFLADIHLGSIAIDYGLFRWYTDYLLENDFIFAGLVGDLTDNFVSFRSMLAVHQQTLNPEQQDEFLESWIKDIKHKILFATWGNHEEFEEHKTGRNIIKRILKHNVVYMNGIGKVLLNVNDIDYEFAVTHKTRYNSSFNITHGLKQLARKDIPNADVYIAGDTHNPAMETAYERGQSQVFLKLGTFKVDCGYSKRYFSYFTSSAMPCVVLDTKEKTVTPFWTLKEALEFIK